MIMAYMEKAGANSTLTGYVPSTVLLWNILIIFSLLSYIISKHRNFLVSAAFDFMISSTQQNNNNHYGGFRREVVVLFLTFNFIGITIFLGSNCSTKPSSSSSHVELDHLDWDFIGTCNHGVVLDQEVYDTSKLLEADNCCEYCYNTISSEEEDDDNNIIDDHVNVVDVDHGCEDYNEHEHDHVMNKYEAFNHGNCGGYEEVDDNDYDVITMDEDDVHGYDGYEEDNDDDDTCGNAYDDDVESEEDDDKEEKEELERRIEDLISKVRQKWREEILFDRLHCMSTA